MRIYILVKESFDKKHRRNHTVFLDKKEASALCGTLKNHEDLINEKNPYEYKKTRYFVEEHDLIETDIC